MLYEAVVTKANNAQSVLDTLSEAIFTADPTEVSFEPDFDAIETTINNVKLWANHKILEADQEKVMDDFLRELKVVFDKFTAKIEFTGQSDGYGETWGGTTLVGVKFTATLGHVTSSREINKTIITSEDL